MKRTIRDAEGLALVASSGRRYGKVRIKLDGMLLQKINLKGPRGVQQVIPIRTGSRALSGTLTIVTANKKRVRIEGLAIITDPSD